MNGPDLSSCWAKVGRAEAHIKAIEKEIGAWANSNPYSLAKKTSPDLTRHGYVISVLKEPDLERWSLIASDAFHNLRCALDHLVYAFAVFESKSNPPPGKTVLSFPICDDPKWFRGAKKKLEPLSACVREEIEFMQPYNRRHARLPPLLGLLRDFDDSDKHRLLHIAMAQAWQREFKDVDHSVVRKGEAIEFFYRTAEVVDDAEIAAIIYPRLSPDMNHKLLTTIVVSIGHRTSPLDRNRRVKTAINNIAAKA